jgi:acetyl esterase/lipase
MALHPQLEALLAEMAKQELPPPETMTVEQNREMFLLFRELAGPPEEVADVVDTTAPGPDGPIPMRLYVPQGERPSPVLVYFHGGGWTVGDIESHDALCRGLANRSGCLVVAVDYRLAPEHPFPAGVADAYAATAWVAEKIGDFGGDAARLAVGGDSAGGNLAAVVSQLAKARGGPSIAFQLLVYPSVERHDDSPSMHENADGPVLTVAWMEWFWSHYLTGPDDAFDPRVSPGLAPDLSGLPPALVITAEYDPLRDQGARYAQQLRDAGVDAEHRNYDGMVHGFFQMAGVLDGGREVLGDAAATLRNRLI